MMKGLIFLCVIATCALALPYHDDSSRIIGGTEAKLGDIPYIVKLKVKNNFNCGGSILDNWHVLTAANCVYKQQPKDLSIQYGIVELASTKNVVQVDKIFVHSKYNPGSSPVRFQNDIAVLKLKTHIRLSPDAQMVFLPKQGEAPPGDEKSTLAGWGFERNDGNTNPAKVLQKVDLLVYPDTNCTEAHGKSVNKQYHLCSGIPEGGKAPCRGDAGGPLLSHGKQIGVVSWSVIPCDGKGKPGVYTRVANYVSWIYGILNEKA